MIDINNLTIGQIKEIKSLIGGACITNNNTPSEPKSSFYSKYIGKYVICRSRNEGVNAGTVLEIDETGVVLSGARRLYYHKPANKSVSWYEGVAVSGISNDSKVGVAVDKIIAEDYSLTVCSEQAKASIMSAKDYEQN